MELEGKNVIITGAAKRLGRAFALALSDRGANVAIHYHSSKREAEDTVQQLIDKGVKSIAIRANIEKPKSIAKVINKAYEFLGNIDILINNAAVFYPTPIDDVSDKDWETFININCRAHFYFAREFARLSNNGPRKIVNMADSYGESPAAKFIPYGVSKAGVITLTKGLAKAYAPDILVNCVCPGPILPREAECSGGPPWPPADMAGTESGHYGPTRKAVSATLLKRKGSVEDITKTVLYLCENDYITGQAIFVDGGRFV